MKTLLFSVAIAMTTVGAIAADTNAVQTSAGAAASSINKDVTTHITVAANSRVDDDIDAWCRETGHKLGFTKDNDSFYIKGVARVTANVKDPTFVKSRSLAFARAYQNAVTEYVALKFGRNVAEQLDRTFEDNSQGVSDIRDVKSSVERIVEKTYQLTEAKLDEGLRKMGVTPLGSITERRKLAQKLIIKKSIVKAYGDSSGLLPVQSFEGWDESGKYAVGVVIRGGEITTNLAKELCERRKPSLSKPDLGLTVEEALPDAKQLVSQFGVRMFFDKNGTPALLSIGQWGSSYTGQSEERADSAMDRAREQAKHEADDFITMFINSTLAMRDESERGEDVSTDLNTYEDGAKFERDIKASIDRIFKESRMRGSDDMIGRATVAGFPKVIEHPSGQKIAVCARVWSYDQYKAMSGVKDVPKAKKPQPSKPGKPGDNRGRTYDF